jgi:hypothetical protein
MKSANVKTTTKLVAKKLVAKVMTIGLLAGAFVMAAPMKAEAQGFAVGVQLGYPQYDYSHRGHWEQERFERERREAFARQQAFERQQAFLRHETWEREQRHHGFDRDDRFRGGDRDDYRGR